MHSGTKASDNYAGKGYSALKIWKKGSLNQRWHYGWDHDTWGETWEASEINDSDFGVSIQVRNILAGSIEGIIEDIEVRVTYLPLVRFCPSDCPIFYVDSIDNTTNYQWHIPSHFQLISKSDQFHIINLHVKPNTPSGIYEICVDAVENGTVTSTCCRSFTYQMCQPGSIGDFVFEDRNRNGLQDDNEPGVPQIPIELFNSDDQLVGQTFSNNDGLYLFDNLEPDEYYIKVNLDDHFEFSPPLAGPQGEDSNINNENGEGTSNTFKLDFDQSNLTIDVGVIGLADIGGIAWEDLNANGVRENGEPLLDSVSVLLQDTFGNVIASQLTVNGNYLFEDQFYGFYRVEFKFDSAYQATLPMVGAQDTNSDIDESFTTEVLSLGQSGLMDIDGGAFRLGKVGDLLWYDDNCNGIFDTNEEGLGQVKLLLIDDQDVIIENTFTDSLGNYLFEEVRPGVYYVEVQADNYTAVEGGDSKLKVVNDRLITGTFEIISDEFQDDIDLAVINLRADICGSVWFDLNFDGLREVGEEGIEDLQILLLNSSLDTLLQTVSDSDGSYCFTELLPGQYIVQFEVNNNQIYSPALIGTDSTINSDVISDDGKTMLLLLQSGKNILNIDAGLGNKGKISGEVWLEEELNDIQDNFESGVENVTINLLDDLGNQISTTNSDLNGAYQYDLIAPGEYYIQIVYPDIYKAVFDIGGDPLINSEITDANGSNTTNLFVINANDEIDNFDFGLASNLGQICGLVWFDENYDGQRDINEVLVEGTTVNLLDEQGSILYSQISGPGGSYCFEDLDPGDYQVQFIIDEYQIFSPQNLGPDVTDSDVISDAGFTSTITLSFGDQIQNIDAGLANKGVIGDFVWLDDMDVNGLQDPSEIDGLSDVLIYLFDSNGSKVDSTTSDANGGYIFDRVIPGDYYMQVSIGPGLKTALKTGSDDSIDSDITGSNGPNTTDVFNVFANSINFDLDFGIQNNLGQICGKAFQDLNADGINSINDGLVNQPILIELYNENDSLIAIRNTNIVGSFCFDVPQEGNYYLKAVFGDDLQLTLKDAGPDDNVDNDFNEFGNTDIVSINFGDQITLDPGFTFTSTLGNFIWLDANYNGIQDIGEVGLEGVQVFLLDELGNTLESTASNFDGFYEFVNVRRGNYQLQFENLDTLEFTIQNADPFIGSVPDSSGLSSVFSVLPNINDLEKDAGLIIPLSSIKGLAFLDVNNDDVRGVDDMLIPGISVNLLNEQGDVLQSTMTDNMGNYCFESLDEGSYIVQFDTTYGAPFVSPFQGGNSVDSDVTEAFFSGSTEILNVVNNQDLLNIDAGYSGVMGVVKGITWEDVNGDGVLDSLDNVIDSITVYLYSQDSVLMDSTLSDFNGEYIFEVQDEGVYFVTFELPDTCFVISDPFQGSNELIDSDITGNFLEYGTDTFYIGQNNMVCGLNAGYIGLSQISGLSFVDENDDDIRQIGEFGFNGIEILLIDLQGETIATDTTRLINGVEGVFNMSNILPGDYILQYQRPLFYFPVEPNIGNDTFDSEFIKIDDLIAQTQTFKVTSKSDISGNDLGLFFMQEFQSSIAGSIWRDDNVNGLEEAGEALVSEVQINLYDENDDLIASQMSDLSGAYLFDMLTEGFYYLEVLVSMDSTASLYQIGNDPTIDNDFQLLNNQVRTELFFLANFMDTTDMDLGLSAATNIGDFVWEDLDFDGNQDADEPGVAGIQINLLDDMGALVNSTISDINGAYGFDRLLATNYQLQALIPDTISVTKQDIGADDIDNDFDTNGLTSLIDFSNLTVMDDVDLGLVRNGCIGDRVWVDFNGNGAQNNTEPGQAGVMVRLFDVNGILIAEDSTKATSIDDAFYKFDNISPGDYYVVFDTLPGYMFTTPDNADDMMDSDVTSSIVFGSTDIFTLLPGEFKEDIDAGVFFPGKLGDFVWLDENENGIQDSGEQGLENVEVNLLMPNGMVVQTTQTDEDGVYCFTGLKQGLYRIEFPMLAEYEITLQDAGASDMEDSDADPSNGRTSLISLAHGATFLGVDCGYFETQQRNEAPVAFRSNVERLDPRPNPAVFETFLEVETDGFYEIQIVNTHGQTSRVFNTYSSNKLITINVKELEVGQYFIYVKGPSDRKYKGSFIRVF